MSVVVLIGRILFVVLFLGSAVGHLTKGKDMAAYAKSSGVPFPEVAVLVSGLAWLVGGLSVLLGVWADLGSLLLAVVLLASAVEMHAYWKESDAQAKQMQMTQFNKNVALAGAALIMFAFFAYAGHRLGLVITGPAIHLH